MACYLVIRLCNSLGEEKKSKWNKNYAQRGHKMLLINVCFFVGATASVKLDNKSIFNKKTNQIVMTSIIEPKYVFRTLKILSVLVLKIRWIIHVCIKSC